MKTAQSPWFEEQSTVCGQVCEHSVVLASFLQTTTERRPQLLQVARRITNHNEDAEDILQEAFLKAYKALPNFRGEAKMSTWLTAIVKNTAREHLRSKGNRIFLSIEHTSGADNEMVAMDLPDPGHNPEESCERREIEKILQAEVGKLNRGCRQVIERCIFQEQPQLEVAQALHVKVATVKARVYRAKRMLGRALAQYETSWGTVGTATAG